MHCGTIATPPETGYAVDLQHTVESGQTFCWRRADGHGEMFDDTTNPTYVTILPRTETPTDQPEPVRVWQPTPEELCWEARFDAAPIVRQLLRLDDDLATIHQTLPDDAVLDRAFDAEWGLRVPNDPVFPTLISFICSAQMSVPRIHAMQVALADTFGTPIEFDSTTYHAFPTPNALAAASEDALRELKLGYRAPYVNRTAELVTTDDHPRAFTSLSYEDAHSRLQDYVGVGNKVADCVQLYALGQLSALPVDTWIRDVLGNHYPELTAGTYQGTSRLAREYFGDYAGYAQSYLFAHARAE